MKSKVKGRTRNAIKVIFLGFRESPKTVVLPRPATIKDLLAALDIALRREDVLFVRGKTRPLDFPLKPGDVIVRVFPIRAAAIAKVNGDIWQVHKTDPDEIFPSDFHGHNRIAPETLDVYTGVVYDAKTRRAVRKLSKRALSEVLDKLTRSKEPEIQQKCRAIIG